MNTQLSLMVGGLFALLAVILGALGAHGLNHLMTENGAQVFELAVRYQFIHALALIACGILLHLFKGSSATKYFGIAAICFIIGILCFSGSLYVLAFVSLKGFGLMTPFGGLSFILGWGVFIFGSTHSNRQ